MVGRLVFDEEALTVPKEPAPAALHSIEQLHHLYGDDADYVKMLEHDYRLACAEIIKRTEHAASAYNRALDWCAQGLRRLAKAHEEIRTRKLLGMLAEAFEAKRKP